MLAPVICFKDSDMPKIPMTVQGADRLKKELHRLKTVDRPTVIQALAEARSHGDLDDRRGSGAVVVAGAGGVRARASGGAG